LGFTKKSKTKCKWSRRLLINKQIFLIYLRMRGLKCELTSITPPRILAHIVMNIPKRGRMKKKLVAKKVIVHKQKQLVKKKFLSLVMFCQKEKIVIHISNIRTFNIRKFKSLDIQSILNIHWCE